MGNLIFQKPFRLFLGSIIALSLGACQTLPGLNSVPLPPEQQHALQNIPNQKRVSQPLTRDSFRVQNQAFQGQSSSQTPEAIRKPFVDGHIFERGRGKTQTETVTFQVESEDTQRQFILTIFNGPQGYDDVKSAVVKLDGQPLLVPANFQKGLILNPPKKAKGQKGQDSISWGLTLSGGSHTLEVELRGKPGSALKIQLDGFANVAQLPDATHSQLVYSQALKSAPYYQGLVNFKFLEGLKVSQDGADFSEQEGINLEALNTLLADWPIQKVRRVFNQAAPQTYDNYEALIEQAQGTEIPNLNLFYTLVLDENQDVWAVIEALQELPFIESAYPTFIPEKPELEAENNGDGNWRSAMNIDELAMELNQKNTRSPENKKVKLALLDWGYRAHKDIVFQGSDADDTQLQNTRSDGQVPEHGLRNAGLLWAQPSQDHTGGVAYNIANKLIIEAFNHPDNASGADLKCLGTGSGCDPLVDALALAEQQFSKGDQAYIVNANAWYWAGTTAEQGNPNARAWIANQAYRNYTTAPQVVYVFPTGNAPCEDGDAACIAQSEAHGFLKPNTNPTVPADRQLQNQLSAADNPLSPGRSPAIIVGEAQPVFAEDGQTVTQLTLPYGDALSYSGLNIRPYAVTGKALSPGDYGVTVNTPTQGYQTTGLNHSYTASSRSASGAAAVSGVIALMLEVNPHLSATEINSILQATRREVENTPLAGLIDGQAAVCLAAENTSSDGVALNTIAACQSGPSLDDIWSQAPNPLPAGATVWITRHTKALEAYPGDAVGIGLDNHDLSGLQLQLLDETGQLTAVPIQVRENNYVVFQIPETIRLGLTQLKLILNRNELLLEEALNIKAPPYLKEVQQLSSSAATSVASFSENGNHYLALANHYNGSSFNLAVNIYHWDGNQFKNIQNISSKGAYDVETFNINGTTYLAIANFYSGRYYINSQIYRWNGSQFELLQNITTQGAAAWEAFSIGSEHYLAVANYRANTSGKIFPIYSVIYRWNGNQFEAMQNILTHGAFDWAHLEVEGQHFLALAGLLDQGEAEGATHIYRWNGIEFETFQSVQATNAINWETIKVADKSFLGLVSGGAHRKTELFQWDGTAFIPFQSFDSQYSTGLKSFSKAGQDYLLVGGGEPDNNASYTELYRWSENQYNLYQTLYDVDSITDWTVMDINGQLTLIAGARYSTAEEGYNTTSFVFEF